MAFSIRDVSDHWGTGKPPEPLGTSNAACEADVLASGSAHRAGSAPRTPSATGTLAIPSSVDTVTSPATNPACPPRRAAST